MMWPRKPPSILEYILMLVTAVYNALPCIHSTHSIAKPSWPCTPGHPECRFDRYCVRCKRIVGCGCGKCPSSYGN